MRQLFPIAIIVLLLAIAGGRWLARHSLGLLTVEQKARVLDASSIGNIWHLLCLALGLVVFNWFLPGRIPLPYLFGFLGVYFLTLLLVSAGATASKVIRLSRAGLPQSYIRGVAWRAILFFMALLLLLSVFLYSLADYAKHRESGAQASSQSMGQAPRRRNL